MQYNLKLLNSLYFIAPILLAVVFFDSIFLNNELKISLPTTFKDILIYQFIFNLPHIIWSIFIFKDRKLLKRYKEFPKIKILTYILIPLMIFIIDMSLGFFFIYWITTVHVYNQQLRLMNSYFKKDKISNYFFFGFNILFFFLTIISTKNLGYDNIFINTFYGDYLFIFLITSLFLLFISNFKKSIKENNQVFKHYIYNFILFSLSIYFFYKGYILFGIFILRFVHDITAFYYYYKYEKNNLKKTNNEILNRVMLILLLNLLLINTNYFIIVTIIISLFHYYIETFIWKKEYL
jgi:hypothetical protein